MKVLIYVNKSKESALSSAEKLKTILDLKKIEYSVIDEPDLNKKIDGANALFVLGGDGTILKVTSFCIENDLPIIGVNTGKMGFLSEFEPEEMENAVDLLLSGDFIKDERITLVSEYKGIRYIALNDCVIQRTYSDSTSDLVVTLEVSIDDNKVDKIKGDGVIISTPTGSTAYSLSAGGAILAPGINAFSVTPISSHSLLSRPVIYSAEVVCKIRSVSDNSALVIDGKPVAHIKNGDTVKTYKGDKGIVFLRKKNSDFYRKLSEKLSKREIF